MFTIHMSYALPQNTSPSGQWMAPPGVMDATVQQIIKSTGIERMTQNIIPTILAKGLYPVGTSPIYERENIANLSDNKVVFNNALKSLKITDQKDIAFYYGVGFAETGHLSAVEAHLQGQCDSNQLDVFGRTCGPREGESTNFGLLNLNLNAIRLSEPSYPAEIMNIPDLNDRFNKDTEQSMMESLKVAQSLVQKYGKGGFLAFHRGGSSGLSDYRSGNIECPSVKGSDVTPDYCSGYRNAIAANAYIVLQDSSKSIFTNDIRV